MKNHYNLVWLMSLIMVLKLNAQNYSPNSVIFHANDIRTSFSAGGSMFWDEKYDDNLHYFVPFEVGNSSGTIYNGAFWMGTVDDDGILRVAAKQFDQLQLESDYFPGPLDPNTGQPFSTADIINFNKVWSVSRYEIEQHIADFEDNGTIDQPNLSVIGWPGMENPYFSTINGFKMPVMPDGAAPFYDRNGDGKYHPFQGDYPLPEGVSPENIPEQIVWLVYNDAGEHGESSGNPIGMEIQMTAWAFNCYENPLMNKTLFLSQKLINRSGRDYHGFYAGNWTDLDIGCNLDDYTGSAPELNTYFNYNATPADSQNCYDIQSYGKFPPVQAVTYLNQPMASYQISNNYSTQPLIGTTDPSTAEEYYRKLTGFWKDGSPLIHGGSGYDPLATNPMTTKFAFPDNPNDSNGWSQYVEKLPPTDVRGLGNIYFDSFLNGTVKKIDVAFSTHFDPKLNHVEQVSLIYEAIPKIKAMYEAGFPESSCAKPSCYKECIWPGDLNNDGIVNHYDLLALGQGLGKSGPTHNASTIWTPQAGGDWLQSLPNGLNFKYLDADGNGEVELEDFDLTKLHYGKFREAYLKKDIYLEGDDCFLAGSTDLSDGILDKSEGLFNLFVNMNPVDSLVGLAMTIEFDTTYFEHFGNLKTAFDGYPNHSAFGKDEMGDFNGEINFAAYKNDGNLINEANKLFFITQVSPRNVLRSNQTKIRFKNIKGILKNGQELDLGGRDFDLTFSGFETVAIAPSKPNLNIYPNPSDGIFYFKLEDEEVSNLKILDATGRLVKVKPSIHQRDFMLDLSHYPSGIYFMKLTRQEQTETWILVKGK